MSTPIRLTLPMPRLGETMDEGTIAEWLVQPGQSFERGDPLLEVETDKTMVEYPALGGGTLIEALVATGDVIAVGTPIAVIETVDAWDGLETAAPPQAAPNAPAADPQPAAAAQIAADGPGAAPKAGTARPRATPLARRIAQQNGISLGAVTGSGRRGRIEAGDVRAVLGQGASGPAVRVPGGPAAPVYCVHGFAGLGSNWAALRASLQGAGLKTSAPDLPGHGRNPAEAADIGALIDWLAADLAEQAEPVHLVGHSLGAHVAAKAAQRVPSKVARLTLIAPAGCGIDINGAFLSGMSGRPAAGALSHLMRLLGPKAAQLDETSLAAMEKELAGGRLTGLAASAARGDVQNIDTLAPLRALAGRIRVSAIFGLTDRIIPREHVFHLPPDVACHMLDAGHMPHWDAPQQVASIIAAP